MRQTQRYIDPSPEARKQRQTQDSPLNSSGDLRIKWKRDDIIAQKRYFVKFDEPVNSLNDQEIIENRDRIVDSIQNRRHSPSADYKDKEKATYSPQNVDKVKWELPKSKFCSF